jgi:hypothetical protein
MSIQAQIPPALAATHNFIRMHDTDEIIDFGDILDEPVVPSSIDSFGKLSDGPSQQAEQHRAKITRDDIAQDMWDDYVLYRDAHHNRTDINTM